MQQRATTHTGWLTFAAIVLVLAGIHNFTSGVAALHSSTYYGADMLYHNLDVWGWILLIWGAIQAGVGVLAMQERTMGIYGGIAAAAVGAVIWFFFLFSAPLPAAIAVILNVLVIYALTAAGRDSGVLD